MTNKSDRENYKKRKQFENEGIDIKAWRGLRTEHQNSIRHEYVKFALTRAIYEVGYKWDSEVNFPNGREADILSLGPDDGKPVVYEVETDVTDADVKRKLNHFYYPYEDLVRDVIVIDPADVPADIHAAVEYLLSNEVLGSR